MFKFKIYNLWRQVTTKNIETNEGYIPYFGDGDDFPLKWAKVISESPSATSCLSTLCDFIEGAGFNNGELEKKIVNTKGETFFQIHQKTVKEFAQNEGFFWRILYNAQGQATDWEVLPFENCRLRKSDDNGYIGFIDYNPFFGTNEYTSKNKEKTKKYYAFNPKAVVKQILKDKGQYTGQVFFFGTTNALSRFYPIHEAYSAVKWMKIEAGVSDYHEDNINNGFLQPFMLIMKGDPNAPSTNPDYTNEERTRPVTVAEEFDQVVESNFMGAKRVGNMFVQWVGIGEEKPEVLTIPSNNNGDVFITLDNQATKKITTAFKVPGILANIQEGVSLGGDANQMRVAVKLMQQRVVKKQRVLTDSYSTILKLFVNPFNEDISIVPYNPYPEEQGVDDKVWDALTPEEQREWIQDNTDIDLMGTGDLSNPIAPNALYKNSVPIAFPEKVRSKIKSTLDYMDKMQLTCGGKSGKEVANAIVNNQSMGYKQLKRIYNYLKAREQYANALNSEGCDVILYNAWGGKEMFDYLDSKLKELDTWLN